MMAPSSIARDGTMAGALLTRGARVSFDDYLAIPAQNISGLLSLAVSPLQYAWDREHSRPDKAAYRLGRLLHAAILEPLTLMEAFVVNPYQDFRTAAARAWRDLQTELGRSVVTQAQVDAAQEMRAAVLRHKVARYLVADGEPEATFTWTHARTGVLCKGRVDLLNGSVNDIKSCRTITPVGFGRDAARYHYPAKMAWYHDGVQAATGLDLPVKLLCVQSSPPYDVAVYRLSAEDLAAGRQTYNALLDQLVECRAAGAWPGVAPDSELALELPAWTFGQVEPETETLTIGGDPVQW